MNSPIAQRIAILRRQRRYQALLRHLWEIPEFQEWMALVSRQCNVTNPVFFKDEKEIIWHESRRQLFMTWLKMLGQDDIQHIINRIENQNQEKPDNE